jgi:hypothetical protein
MRDDMFKVIVERPRWGSRQRSVKLRYDRDVDRKQIGLRRHVTTRPKLGKSLNENLAPLLRFLQRRIGRRWDDVYSEICAALDTGSTVKMHVREHLDDFVVVRISYGRKGELIHDGRVLRPERGYLRWHGTELYVDPDDGILKDRVWFWRDRGKVSSASWRDLEWGRG